MNLKRECTGRNRTNRNGVNPKRTNQNRINHNHSKPRSLNHDFTKRNSSKRKTILVSDVQFVQKKNRTFVIYKHDFMKGLTDRI